MAEPFEAQSWQRPEQPFKARPIPREWGQLDDPCVTCFRTGTTTGVGFRGTPRAMTAALMAILGFPIEEAKALVEDGVRSRVHPDGIDGSRRSGGDRHSVRDWNYVVCSDCAKRAGITVGAVGQGALPGYDLTGLTEENA